MLEFEWDDAKAGANFRKNGVTFEEAEHPFRDPFTYEWIDERAAYGEERVILLGMSGDQILCVFYTERGERLRII